MKKVMITMLALLMMGNAYADDSFSVGDITLPQNGEAPLAVNYSLGEGSKCSGFTFWIELPEGLSVVHETKTVGEEVRVTVPYTLGDCYYETPTFTPNLSEGYLKVACMTANSDPLTKQSGTLATFRITSDGTLAVDQTFTGKLHHATISDEKGGVHDVASVEFTITIGAPIDMRTVLDELSTEAPEAATGVDVRVKRTLVAGVWNTICLPFAMTAEQVTAAFGNDVQLGDFNGIESTCDEEENIVDITVNFNNATAIEANHPYVIKVKDAISEFTVDGVDIEVEEEPSVDKDEYRTGSGTKKDPYVYHYNSFVGTYVADTEVPELALFLNDNKFYYSTGATKMKAFRGYFDFYDVLTEVENAEARISFVIDEDWMTGISDVKREDDSLYYNLKGMRVAKPGKGLYIVNGKKMVIK